MIDVRTTFLLWTVQAGTLSVLLLVIWLHGRDNRHFLYFGTGLFMHAFGVALLGARGHIPDALSIQVANATMLAGFGFFIAGLSIFDGRKAPVIAALPCLIWVTANLFPFVHEVFAHRAVTYGIATASAFAIMSYIAFTSSFSKPKFRYLLGAIWAIQCASNISFAGITLVQMPQHFQETAIKFFSGIVGVIGFISALILLAKIHLDRSEAALLRLASTDPLTGVANRRGVIEAFGSLKRMSLDERGQIALIVFDLDHFKKINDSHGHQAGDAVLVRFARIAEAAIPSGGILGRSGGEEFVVIARVAQLRDAALIAETIRQGLAAARIETERDTIAATVSIGIHGMANSEADLDKLFSGADRALYRAKSKGRNRTAVLVGDKVVAVPSASSRTFDEQADKQVALLRRLAAAGSDRRDAARS